MNESTATPVIEEPTQTVDKGPERRFFLMITAAIGITLVLVTISLAMYVNSTAIELDLTRPAYQAVRSQVDKDSETASYPSIGQMDDKAIEKFREMFKNQRAKATGVDGFNSSALTDQALELPTIKQ